MIHVGTSGFSFRDWVGPFYPPGTQAGKMLEHYARVFTMVEINSTYYRLPPARSFARMAEKAPARFGFTVKLPGEATHRRVLEPRLYGDFAEAIRPLEEAGKLRGALAQFPFSFRDTAENRDYLRRLRERLPQHRIFVEFRHQSWNRASTLALLREIEAGFCAVDAPPLAGLFPPIAASSGPIGYVRLHGRNREHWWGGDAARRYDYRYNDAELREWADRIARIAAETEDLYVFFNNCHAGQAAENAVEMIDRLREAV